MRKVKNMDKMDIGARQSFSNHPNGLAKKKIVLDKICKNFGHGRFFLSSPPHACIKYLSLIHGIFLSISKPVVKIVLPVI